MNHGRVAMSVTETEDGSARVVSASKRAPGINKSATHELNNVFAAIFANLELAYDDLLDAGADASALRHRLEEIERAARRGERIVQGLDARAPALRAPGGMRGAHALARRDTPVDAATSAVVLVCDDNNMVRSLTVAILRGAGFEVLSADCATRALGLARERDQPIDLLVTDVVMPDMDGEELASALTELCPEMRVLYVSGYAADVLSERLASGAEIDFLEKPYRPAKLLDSVRQALESHG